jgi:uncharacterized membrane protein
MANKALLSAALIGVATASSTALAVPDAPGAWEKCTGIAKAGQNDCGALDGSHGCAGLSKEDASENEWVYVPEGTCEKLAGGKVYQVKSAK